MDPATILVMAAKQRLPNRVRSYLGRDGFRVVDATDRQTALDLARQHQRTLVVLNMGLPMVNGTYVHRLSTCSNAYVPMFTAKAEEIDRSIGLEKGADDDLTKPFSPQELGGVAARCYATRVTAR